MAVRLITLIALSAPLHAAPTREAATPQLVLNGDFEQGEGERAPSWGVWPPWHRDPGVTSHRDERVRRSGAFSGRLEIVPGDFKGIATFHHRNIPVRGGQEYVLTFWHKADTVSGKCGIDVQLRADAKRIVGSRGTGSLKGTFDWKRHTHRFTIPPGVRFIGVVPYLGGTGRYWLDDIELFGVPQMTARRAQTPPKLDGVLSDACWATENCTAEFLCTNAKRPQRGTRAWTTFDDGHVYFAFRCEMKAGDRLKSLVKKRDGDVWTDDDVELFLNFQGDHGDYYQFVVNPAGARYDSHRTDRSWDAEWEASTKISAESWNVEIAIPLTSLPIDLSVGSAWCVNFGRGDKLAGEASSWSCTFGGFHNPGRFGRLTGIGCDFSARYAEAARREQALLKKRFDALSARLTFDATEDIVGEAKASADRIRNMFAAVDAVARRPAAASGEQWQQVRETLPKLRNEIDAFAPASYRLRVFSFWSRKLKRPASWGLVPMSPMVKVFKHGRDLRGDVTDTLRLSAARGEYEGAQVVVAALSQDANGCHIRATDLAGGRGKIPASEIAIHPVGYVRTAKTGYNQGQTDDWPDPFMPLDRVDVPKGEFRPFWVTVHVPYGTPAGAYAGRLIVESDAGRLPMALEVKVWDFDLPKRGHLATPFGCGAAEIAAWYFGDRDYRKTLSVDVWLRWCKFMLDYRLSPTRAGRAYLRRMPRADGLHDWDFSIFDQIMAQLAPRVPERSLAMAGMGGAGWRGTHGGLLTCEEPGRDSPRAALISFPRTERWADISRPIPAAFLAANKIRAISLWLKAGPGNVGNEWMDVYLNSSRTRYVKRITIGETRWHKVAIPLNGFRGNRGEGPLTLDGLPGVRNLQLVIANTKRELSLFLDDLVAESPTGPIVIDDFEPERQHRELMANAGARFAHWKEKGWFDLGHVYGFDELRPAEYPSGIEAYRRLIDALPDAPLMQTYYVNRKPKPLAGLVKVWCAITSVYDEDFLESRRALGEPVWLYVCCGPHPPFANFFIDQPAIDHRILFWQAWQKHATGLLYWRVNYWHGNLPGKPGDPCWPNVPWNMEKAGTYRDHKVNGDGWLIYPGPDLKPYSCVRLENIRDGIEDYEYLWLLRDLVSKAKKREAQARTVGEAERLLAVGQDISETFTKFTRDPSIIMRRREKIAEMIERLRAGLEEG